MNDPGLTPYAGRPDPPSTHRAPPSYRAPGLIPPSGPARTWGLVVITTPLLLAMMVVLLGGAADGSTSSGPYGPYGPSGSSGSSGSGLFGSDTFGTDSSSTADQPTHTPSTRAPAWPYDDTAAPDVYGTPEATATDDFGDGGYPPDTTTGTPAASPTGGPSDVVTAYFEAINARDYQTAWALGGKNLDSSYDRFVSGYATTKRDTIGIVSVEGTRVRLTIEALQADGTTHSYDATYTVRDGVITSGTATRTD
ncbi:hypothetical protein QMZ92_21600 [Streptomyces sp. HNM0645]|uniref:hypothetical protein n=1 Tax=Streptomyces sp. HNM0645 TaxID=2782343 RepID=UPI0024B667FD|nr:hypothetical protein [Streptomyces sp. HNM0645]MDI9886892.1 hypothetical protein [Streptomyces sp. HNM0645]